MIFHRGELHAVLAKAVPPERVHLAHRCVGIEQDRGDRVEAQFENGADCDRRRADRAPTASIPPSAASCSGRSGRASPAAPIAA